jgi:C4-dicarboxylate transporter DctQ subunit
MRYLNKALNHLEEGLVAFLMGGATLIIFVAVAHRYALDMAARWQWDGLYDVLFNIHLNWAQELCIIMFVWMAKFGAAYGVRTGIHVGVDVLINRLQNAARARFILFGLMAGASFTAVVAVMGFRFIWDNGAHFAIFNAWGLDTGALPEGPITPDLEWPTWAVYSAVPLGSSLMCLRFVQVAWGFRRTGELPRHDHGHVEGIDEDTALPAPGDEDAIYAMRDNLHPQDLIVRRGEDRRKDDDPHSGPPVERRCGEDRRHQEQTP